MGRKRKVFVTTEELHTPDGVENAAKRTYAEIRDDMLSRGEYAGTWESLPEADREKFRDIWRDVLKNSHQGTA